MSICKRIISASMAVVITFMLFTAPKAEASLVGDAAYAYTTSTFAQFVVAGGFTYAGYALGGTLGTLALPGIGTVEGTAVGVWAAQAANYGFNELMAYLAEYPVEDVFRRSEENFTSGLDHTTVTHDGLFSVFPGGWYMAENDFLNPAKVESYKGGMSFSDVLFSAVSSSAFAWLFTEPFQLPKGAYSLSLDYASGLPSNTSTKYRNYTEILLQGLKDGTWTDIGSVMNYGSSSYPYTQTVAIPASSSYESFRLASRVYMSSGSVGDERSIERQVHLDCTSLLGSAAQPDISTRLSALANSLNQYNLQHSIQANDQNVNFVLMPVGQDTPINPGLYDEQKLVYTDPVTGGQYLTHGWTYDYLTRCYTLDMADTFVIGDTVIDTIKLTYGDELLTVDHYAAGTLIQSDEYNYVMMSGSECALNGHTYNITDSQDPTCTGAGSISYSCSVCGNQYVEAIPKLDHAYSDFTVEQAPSCTTPGIHSFSCLTCGGQYTDTIAALGHDWQPTQLTEESFVMPDNVRCPDCYGTNFSYTRSDYEILTGKNLFNFPERDLVDPPFGLPSDIRRFDSNSAYVGLTSNGYSNEAFVSVSDFDPDARSFSFLSSSPGYGLGFPFALTPGKTYSLSAGVSGSGSCYLGFYDVEGVFLTYLAFDIINSSFVVPDNVYWTVLVFRGDMANEPCSFTDIQLEEGSEITEYEPYITKEVEIIPPIYTFTCSDSDCGTVWTEEAEYQGATVTYTCTRCDATRTEAAGEDAGLFHSIGNLIADGITWATDKLALLIENLSGMTKIFNEYTEKIKNNVGQYPGFFSALIGMIPEDLMVTFWFAIVALVVLAVWIKWFS